MNKLHIFASLLIALLSLTGCQQDHTQNQDPEADMYQAAELWFDNGRTVDNGLADVFYVLPTCVFDWTDAEGNVCHYASLTDSAQRAAMQPSYELAERIFADSANFFAPYYRHISLDVWTEGEDAVSRLFPYSMQDIRRAFAHYLQHCNQGRPFVLAGFSQGAKCVVELIKEMDPSTAERMIAAYVCGYRITADDIAASALLKPAQGAEDTGVAIAYNTVTRVESICQVVANGNQWTINPASWTTDTDVHALNDSVQIHIDADSKLLVAEGVDEQSAFVPVLEALFPVGNLHLQELTLYQEQLRKNVKQRIKAMK